MPPPPLPLPALVLPFCLTALPALPRYAIPPSITFHGLLCVRHYSVWLIHHRASLTHTSSVRFVQYQFYISAAFYYLPRTLPYVYAVREKEAALYRRWRLRGVLTLLATIPLAAVVTTVPGLLFIRTATFLRSAHRRRDYLVLPAAVLLCHTTIPAVMILFGFFLYHITYR